jgi:co-chaperonin GroES (HSP10)
MLKPINDWVLTKPLEKKEKITDSGILLVTKKQDAIKLVEIISFGPDANKNSLLKANQIVMVPSNTGIKVEKDNEVYEIAKEHNFLGVVE